jgi:PglZ domain
VTEAVASRTGIVSEYVRGLIAKQVDDHGLVVWFDPARDYEQLVASLSIDRTTVVAFKGSFFALRREIDGLLNGESPPRLVVYVPCTEEETQEALIELTSTGVVMKPGQHPWQRNTRLSVVAKAALRASLGEEQLASVEKQVEQRQLSLTDLDGLGASASGPVGVLSRIFGTSSPQEIALALLSGPEYDERVVEKQAGGELSTVLNGSCGAGLAADDGCPAMRERLATHALCTEFLTALGGSPPAQLASLKVASTEPARVECVQLVRAWRSWRELRESYAAQAERVEREVGIASVTFELDQIAGVETFVSLENRIQAVIEEVLSRESMPLADVAPGYRRLIGRRLENFWCSWPERYPEVRQRWLLIETVLNVLSTADAVQVGLKTLSGGPAAMVEAYATGEEPWCLLDTYQRRLERQSHLFDFGVEHSALEAAIARARQRYMQAGGELAERFVRELSSARFKVPGVLKQVDIYNKKLEPCLKSGKTAYVLVDALRFEMGRELAGRLQANHQVTLLPAMASAPTLTPIGMSSLMPEAPDGEVVPVKASKLGLKIGETVLADRKGRLTWLQQHESDRKVVMATLEDLLPQPKKALQTALRTAELIVVTSQEIDELPEGDNIRLAHIAMDNVLLDVARLVNKLRDLGCERIVVTADHGYLFADEMDTDMKIEPPGGQTADLGRRAWIGRGGAASESYLRAPLAALGMGGELDIAVPWGFGVFITPGGARAYFHGGMSPQEMIVPVISLTTAGGGAQSTAPSIEWELVPGSRKISTRYFSVTVQGHTTELLGVEPPKVHVEVRSEGSVISTPVSASYGFVEATRDVQLRVNGEDNHQVEPNTMTLMVEALESHSVATVCLLDAGTGRELARLDDVKISMMAF